MRVIINADDLGFDTATNEAIFSLVDKRRITSATILTNCEGTQAAIVGTRRFPACSFGVHLNATTGMPLSGNPDLGPILDANGRFTRKLFKTRLSAALRRALFAEFCLQIEYILKHGVTISHLDSHHHIHNLPGLLPVLKALQRRYQIRKVRISQNIYPQTSTSRSTLLKKGLFNWTLRNLYRTQTTEGFTSLRIFSQVPRIGDLSYRTLELMVHPGPAAYEPETELLRTGWLEHLPYQIEKINYHEL